MIYTVLLLYPDYIADDFGIETYLAHVNANSVDEAIHDAQHLAVEASQETYECSLTLLNAFDAQDDPIEPEDFAVLAVFAGEHYDLAHH